MSESDRIDGPLAGIPAGGEPLVSQAEIDDVLDDPTMSPAERGQRLAELRQRILDREHDDGDDAYEPLQTRIMDALSMLAGGGHDYAGTVLDDGDPADEVALDDRSERT